MVLGELLWFSCWLDLFVLFELGLMVVALLFWFGFVWLLQLCFRFAAGCFACGGFGVFRWLVLVWVLWFCVCWLGLVVWLRFDL